MKHKKPGYLSYAIIQRKNHFQHKSEYGKLYHRNMNLVTKTIGF